MKKNVILLILAAVAALIVAAGALTPARGQQGGPGKDDPRAFIALMDGYLDVAARWVDLAAEADSAGYLAIEGIVEIYESRGARDKAIAHLQRLRDGSGDNQALRNLIGFKIRDLLNETGRSDAALAELDRIVEENR